MTYDDWKLMSPDEERRQTAYVSECPFCGAWRGEICKLDDGLQEPPCNTEPAWGEERDPDAERQQREDDRMDREQDR